MIIGQLDKSATYVQFNVRNVSPRHTRNSTLQLYHRAKDESPLSRICEAAYITLNPRVMPGPDLPCATADHKDFV